MNTGEDHQTSLEQQEVQVAEPLPSSLDYSRRVRSKRPTSPGLVIAKDRAHPRRPSDAIATTSALSDTKQNFRSRSNSEELQRRSPRHATSSASNSRSGSPTRRYFERQEDASFIKKQVNPLKFRQRKKSMPFENLPPSPMAVFFDAQGMSNEDGDQISRAVNLISSSTAVSSSSVESISAREKTYVQSPAFSNEEKSVDDMESSDSIGELSLSLSSEIDTPGPITPATPAWKPRELTLLKKNADSSHDSLSRGSAGGDRDRQLFGLGLQSPAPSLFHNEDAIRSTRTSRPLAKDILPIGNSAHSQRTSPLLGNVPRELKLAPAGGPSNPLRGKSQPYLSSAPLLSSYPQHPRPSLPILPPGPTFSSDQQRQASTRSQSFSSQRIPSNAESVVYSSQQELAVRKGASGDDSIPLPRSRNISMPESPSFTRRAQSATAGSRRKAPPATLDLGPSIGSSYNRLPADSSDPTSGSTSLPTPQTSPYGDRLSGNPSTSPRGSRGRQVAHSPLSPLGPKITSGSNTPVQSSIASSIAVMDASQLQEQVYSTEQPETLAYIDYSSSRAALDGINAETTPFSDPLSEQGTGLALEDKVSTSSPFGSNIVHTDKKSSLQASEASSNSIDSQFVEQKPSLALGVAFNEDIFIGQGQGIDNDGHVGKSAERERGIVSVTSSPFASPGPRHSMMSSSAASGQRSRANSLHQYQARLPLAPPPNLPLPVLPTLLVKSPSDEGARMQWEQHSNDQAVDRTETSLSIHSSHNLESSSPARSHLDRPLPPLPKPKPTLVPDVPSFGYTGPINSKPAEDNEEPYSYASLEKYAAFNEESAAASRWSSGSESEEEASTAKQVYRKSFKQRKSSGSVSAQSAKKNSALGGSGVSPSTTIANKKGGFFAGLGLRKKSTPNLSSQASPLPMYADSPNPGTGMAEFPFPTNSPASYSQQSFSTANSRRGSNVQMPSPALSSILSDSQARSNLHPSHIKPVSSIQSTTIKPLDSSLRMTTALAASAPVFPNTPSQSPALEQISGPNQNNRGLGIQLPVKGGQSDDGLISMSTDSNIEEIEEKPGKTLWRKYKAHREREQADKGQSKGLFGLRKHSEEKDARSKSHNGLSSPSGGMTTSSTVSSFAALNTMEDETPRLPYASLADQHDSFTNEGKPESSRTINDAAGLEALGHLLVRSPSEEVLSIAAPALKQSDGKSGHATRRLLVEGASARPRYPSLTEEGKEWREQHPDTAFGGAQGLNLLCTVLSGGQNPGGRVNGVNSASDGSDSGTDDYGSSEGGAGGQGSGDASQGGHGEGGNQGDDDKQFNKKALEAPAEENLEDSSSDSEDSYGGSDDEGAPPATADSSRLRADRSSCSSDDVPLGQRVRDPDHLQRQLRQMASKTKRKNAAPLALAAKAELPSNDLHFVLDADDLAARLTKVQLQREATEGQRVSEGSSSASAVISRNQSLARKGPTYSQMMPAAPPLPIQGPSRLLPKTAIVPIQTSNLISAGIEQGQSSPMSPSFRQLLPSSSATAQTESSEVSMKTALEAQSSSSSSQQREDHRSAVVADFANTIKARSRSRSFGMPFPPALDISRLPPVPSRSVLVPQSINVSPLPKNAIAKDEKTPDQDVSSHSSSSIASPKNRSGSTGFKASPSSDDHENVSRFRQVATPNFSMIQHRVYLLNKQRCGTAEVEMNARVRDVVHSVMEREPMPLDSRTGGWVLYDVCAELGIERPIREYELVSEVIALRSDAQNDYFVLKRTELAPYLSIKNVPNSSAALAGWVYLQDNHRKKWNKRWLELRDNCLYTAKTEKGKDEGLLCSLSSFDVYLTDSSRVKTPKQHSFALRSQNSINMFESPEADYVHYFSLGDAGASRHWITAILNARTFVLRQEKGHLFRFNAVATPVAPLATAIPYPNDQTGRSTIRQRAPLTDTGSSPTKAGTTTSPLLTFSQTSFPKGSLMEERFSRSATTANETSGQSSLNDRKRREEVQLAERKGRKEGKPLVGIIPDVARPINGLGSNRV